MATTISIVAARPDSEPAKELLAELDAELHRYPYTPESRHAFSIDKLIQENVAFFVMTYDGGLVGCGGVKLFDDYGEVKRMYVRPAFRRKGFGVAILDHLAQYAKGNGIRSLRLETGIYQTDATALYERWGFQRRGPFGDYRDHPHTVFFEKAIS
jgi:GNAT superfamily N-acetyltransferase